MADQEFSQSQRRYEIVKRLCRESVHQELRRYIETRDLSAAPLLNNALRKTLTFPPFLSNKKEVQKSIDNMMEELPSLISSYETATQKDMIGKISKLIANNMIYALVPVTTESIKDNEVNPNDKDTRYHYQRQLLKTFTLFLAGIENDGGIEGFVTKIQAYHSITELPHLYKLIFTHLQEFMFHSVIRFIEMPEKVAHLKKVYSRIPQQPILTLTGFKTASSALLGLFNLIFVRPPLIDNNLFQRFMMSKVDVEEVEEKLTYYKNLQKDGPYGTMMYDCVVERYPVPWTEFCKRPLIQAALKEYLEKSRKETPKNSSTSSLKAFVSTKISSLTSSSSMTNMHVTNEDIDNLDDKQCGDLWNIAFHTIKYLDKLEYIKFLGSKPVTDIAETLLKSLAGPISEVTYHGGMRDMLNDAFDFLNQLFPLVNDQSISQEDKESKINDLLYNLLDSTYNFLHQAISLDSGDVVSVLDWIFRSYTDANGSLDFDILCEDLNEEEKKLLWKEVDSFMHFTRFKGLKPGLVKPELVHIKKILPNFNTLMKERLVLHQTGDADMTCSVHNLLNDMENLNIFEDSNQSAKVITHIQISQQSSASQSLTSRGFENVGTLYNHTFFVKSLPINSNFPPICDFRISHEDQIEAHKEAGYILINADLSKGHFSGKKTFLLYQRQDVLEKAVAPIVDIKISWHDILIDHPEYVKVHPPLQQTLSTGKKCHLWIKRLVKTI